MIRIRRFDVSAALYQSLFQFSNAMLHVAVLLFEPLDVSSLCSTTSDPVCGATFCIVLQTWRTASRKSIATDFSNLFVEMLIVAVYGRVD